MTREELIDIFREALDLDPSIQIEPSTSLESFLEWDSMAMVSLLATLDLRYDIITSAQQLRNSRTVADLIAIAGAK